MISRVVVGSTVAVVTTVCAGAVVVAVVVVVSVSLSVVVVSRAKPPVAARPATAAPAAKSARKMVSFAALRRIRVDRMLPAGGRWTSPTAGETSVTFAAEQVDVENEGRDFGGGVWNVEIDLTMSPVATASLRYMNAFSSPPGGEGSGTGDPVSWLQIEPGWSVVGSDGELVGSVVSVAGDKQDDIFDGLAISVGESVPLRYVPGEIVGLIFPGKVSVRFRRDESDELDEFEAPKPLTVWRPSAPSLGTRLTNWMRGRR